MPTFGSPFSRDTLAELGELSESAAQKMKAAAIINRPPWLAEYRVIKCRVIYILRLRQNSSSQHLYLSTFHLTVIDTDSRSKLTSLDSGLLRAPCNRIYPLVLLDIDDSTWALFFWPPSGHLYSALHNSLSLTRSIKVCLGCLNIILFYSHFHDDSVSNSPTTKDEMSQRLGMESGFYMSFVLSSLCPIWEFPYRSSLH